MSTTTLQEEINQAHDLIIKQTEQILQKSKCDIAQLQEVGAAGFIACKEVQETTGLSKHYDKLKKIEEYKRCYPLNKFIDKETALALCEKYGLYLVSASRYTGEIPEKNQKEIATFRFYDTDYRHPDELLQNRFMTVSVGWMGDGGFRDDAVKIVSSRKVKPRTLACIAPIEKINTSDMVVDGRIIKDPDPIVLQPVEHGYLIVTSWGMEASDPLVINEINN